MIRIAVTGPESTGKSTLASNLATHYHTVFNPEYAREYIDMLDHPYVYEDVEKIAREQMKREKRLLQDASGILFADTELLVIKVWMEHKYKKFPSWLPGALIRNRYDLYLLCDVDVPWEEDPQREHPHMRAYFFEKYRAELDHLKFPYVVVSGNWVERFNNAVKSVDKISAISK